MNHQLGSAILHDQKYVQRFTILYCGIILGFSVYFTPRGFNLKVALITNTLFFLIGAPFWFKFTKIPTHWLNIISQISNTLASLWVCAFLGPSSHTNLVAIPQFILVLMMFPTKPLLRYFFGSMCLVILFTPIYPFVNELYLHRRLKENELVILRAVMDLGILIMTTYQVRVIVDAWRDALKKIQQDKKLIEIESQWRQRLINIICHDIKAPMVYGLQSIRKLKKENNSEMDLKVINRIENSQMVVREVISNVESLSSNDSELDLPKSLVSLEDVLKKILPWLKGRLEDQSVRLKINDHSSDNLLFVNPETFTYQIFNNLLTNAINFSPANSEIIISTEKLDSGIVRWSIKDQGPGIPHEATGDEIFKSPNPRGSMGSGLGIRIARMFSEKQAISLSWKSSRIDSSFTEAGTVVHVEQNAQAISLNSKKIE